MRINFGLIGLKLLVLIGMTQPVLAQANPDNMVKPPDMDVAGVRLGETLVASDATLIKAGWTLVKESQFAITGTQITFTRDRTYQKKGASGKSDQMKLTFSRPPATEKVIIVERRFTPQYDQLLSGAKAKQSLEMRYGAPIGATDSSMVNRLNWYVGSNAPKCAAFDPNAIFNSRRGTRAAFIEPEARECDGVFLRAGLHYANRTVNDAIHLMTVDLYDLSEWKTDENRFNDYAASLESERQKKLLESTPAPEL
jgi:hypothetical protein